MKQNKKKKEGLSFFQSSKTILKSVREYKKASILSPIFVMLEVILEVFIPLIMTFLLEKIKGINESGSGDIIGEILKYGCILLATAFASLLFGALSGKFCAKASSGFAKNLRKDMFHSIQDFSFSNIDKFSSASLITRLTTDVTNVEMSYMMIIRVAVRAPFMLIFSMVMAFTLNSKMALIFLATVPILGIGLFLIMTKAIPFFQRIFHKYDALNESVEENISAMRVVKSYVREDYEKNKFDKASSNVKNDFTKAEKLIALNTPLMNFCVYAGLIAIYVIGSIFIVKSNEEILKLTQLQSFMAYSFQMLMSLMMVSMIMVMIIMSTASIKRIAEVLNEKSNLTSKENAITEIKDGSFEFRNVCFKYSEKAEKFALSNVNLKVESGETIGIIGSTGSSKSTLVQLIPRLYDVTEGEVLVGGINVKEYDLNQLRDNVAMVLQKNILFSGTIRDNMKWGNKNATDEEIFNALKLAQAYDFVNAYEEKLDKHVDQGGSNFSGGQKQRLCIARALLKNPKIIVLDDSTSAVDTKTDALIRMAFEKYIPSTTKIIIAQRIASIKDADKIIIMENGGIADVGNHDYLIKNNEIYKELYYSQNTHQKNDKEVI